MKRYFLFESRFGEFYVCSMREPIYKIEKLQHHLGNDKTHKGAFDKGLAIFDHRIRVIQDKRAQFVKQFKKEGR